MNLIYRRPKVTRSTFNKLPFGAVHVSIVAPVPLVKTGRRWALYLNGNVSVLVSDITAQATVVPGVYLESHPPVALLPT